jgi:hypothetical protein
VGESDAKPHSRSSTGAVHISNSEYVAGIEQSQGRAATAAPSKILFIGFCGRKRPYLTHGDFLGVCVRGRAVLRWRTPNRSLTQSPVRKPHAAARKYRHSDGTC